MQIGGYSDAPLRLTEQIQKVVWRGLVTEEMLQANPKDLRKSPGGRAGLKNYLSQWISRWSPLCWKKSERLLVLFWIFQISLLFPSRSLSLMSLHSLPEVVASWIYREVIGVPMTLLEYSGRKNVGWPIKRTEGKLLGFSCLPTSWSLLLAFQTSWILLLAVAKRIHRTSARTVDGWCQW